MATKNVTLQDLIDDLDPALKKILYKDFRTELDSRPTILDITYRTLKVNNPSPGFKKVHDTLLQVVAEKATRQYARLEDIPSGYFTGKQPYIIYINGDANNKFLVAKSVKPIRTFISNNISNDPRIVNSLFGQRTTTKEILNKKGVPSGDVKTTTVSNVDIGHISSAENIYLVSPLEEKLLSVIEYGEVTSNQRAVKYASDVLNELYALQADIDYTFKNTTPQSLASIGNKLGEFFVVVTLHTSKLNQQFSDTEKLLFAKLRAQLGLLASAKLRDKFLNLSGSNTILEDITKNLLAIVRTGKNAKLSGHKTNKAKTPTINLPKKVVTQATGAFSEMSPMPRVRDVATLYSLANLQQLINDSLQNVISAKMGGGGATNVLNYRTGRFAASAKVERMSSSREGMITAFYTYMKNPYQTFEPGYRQGTIKSRDPKLLISESIREIAATRVANRMRAVSV